MKKKGLLLVVSGPSGCGKGTVLGKLFERRADMAYSVSATTRSPRPGEEEGVQYFFLTRAAFEEKIASGAMLEYAEYAGNYYGTPLAAVERKLEEGKNVVLEIEVQGAKKVKALRPDAVMTFILPPDMEELRRRLTLRGTESPEVIERRMQAALTEMPQAKDYDYIVLNDRSEQAARLLDAIVTAEQLRAGRSLDALEQALKDSAPLGARTPEKVIHETLCTD